MKKTLLLAGMLLSAAMTSAQEIPDYLIEDKSSLSEHYYHHHNAKKSHTAKLLAERPSAIVRRPYDVLKYDLYMDWVPPLSKTAVTGTSRYYSGKNEILLKIDSANVTNIILNAGSLRIDSVLMNGQSKVNFTQPQNEEFSVALPAAPAQGSELNLHVYYTYIGMINNGFYLYAKAEEDPMSNDIVEERLAYTMSEPFDARHWMPCNDHPYDKAKATIRVRVPEGFLVSSNGLLKSQTTTAGMTTFEWSDTTQITTYLMVANASKFATYSEWYKRISNPSDSIEVKYYVWPKDYENTEVGNGSYNARNAFKNTIRMMEWYSTILTEYPFVKYGMTAVQPFNFGGMEHQTMTTVHRDWLRGADAGIAHELMHQWTGDLVTCATFKDLWLNEGGATWGEALWNEEWGGKEWYTRTMNSKKGAYLNGSQSHEIPIYDAGSSVNIFSFPLTYVKPAWVYHMLRSMLGDDVFFPAFKAYLNEFAYTSIETEDMVKFFEKQVPNPPVPFRTFFNQWIYQAGHPKYRMDASSKTNGAGGFIASITLRQIQFGNNTPEVFVMPVKITFKSTTGEEVTHTILNDQRLQMSEFALSFAPDSVLLDRNDEILCEKSVFVSATAINDEPGIARQDSYSMFPNPVKAGEVATIDYTVYNSKAVKIEVVNSIGQTIEVLKEGVVHPGKYPLQYRTDALSSGVYSLRISSDSGIQNIPFVVIR
jgi:aminopeptidase N